MKYKPLKYLALAAGLAGMLSTCTNIRYYPRDSPLNPANINVGIFGNVKVLEVTTPNGKKMYYTYKITNSGLEEVRYLREVVGDLERRAVTQTREKSSE